MRTSADYLHGLLVGKKAINVFTLSAGRYSNKFPDGHLEFLEAVGTYGHPIIEDVNVHGKFMYWTVQFEGETEPWFLWTTYGMSGQWLTRQDKHAAYGLYFYDPADPSGSCSELYFVDPRHFGTLKWVRGRQLLKKKLLTLGPDILAASIPDHVSLAKRCSKKPDAEICKVLMDQRTIAGVGNYIKSEALYRAAISPKRLVKDIDPSEWRVLCESIVAVATESYESQGSTISTYKNPDGSTGKGQFKFRVYGQAMDPNGRKVISEQTTDGRTSWWVPDIQK